VILVRPFAPAVSVGIVALAFPVGFAGLRIIVTRRVPPILALGRLRLVHATIAIAAARCVRVLATDPVALLEFGPTVVHGLLRVDDFAENLLGNFLILAAAVAGVDDPDGVGSAGRLFEEFAGDGATLVLVLDIIALFIVADVTPP